MTKYKLFFSLIALFFLSVSCEDVIELDLNEGEPRLVIEGFITDQPGPYIIEINKTVGFYESNDFPPQSGAKVIIADNEGIEDILEEVRPGVYQTTTIQGQVGKTYTLTVEYEGQIITASSEMPSQQIPIDSLVLRYEEESLFYDEGQYVTAYFQDPAAVENFYRLNIFVNGDVYNFSEDDPDDFTADDDNFYLTRDKFSDGNIQDFGFFLTLQPSDSVYVELHQLNRTTFEYYRTLIDGTDSGGIAPANPISNFGTQALGYFGAFSVTSKSVVVQ